MGMTMTQKILAQHAGLPEVRAGQLIQARLDLVLGNDITSPVAINEFEAGGFTKVFDKSRIAMPPTAGAGTARWPQRCPRSTSPPGRTW